MKVDASQGEISKEDAQWLEEAVSLYQKLSPTEIALVDTMSELLNDARTVTNLSRVYSANSHITDGDGDLQRLLLLLYEKRRSFLEANPKWAQAPVLTSHSTARRLDCICPQCSDAVGQFGLGGKLYPLVGKEVQIDGRGTAAFKLLSVRSSSLKVDVVPRGGSTTEEIDAEKILTTSDVATDHII